MQGIRHTPSFIKFGCQTFSLLSAKQRAGALTNIIFSIVQALLEVISVAAVIPFFYLIIRDAEGNDSLPEAVVLLTNSFTWQSILAIVVSVFIFKNLLSLWFTHNQSRYIKEVSVSFSEQLYQRFYQQSWTDYLHTNSAETVRKINTAPSDFANHIVLSILLLCTDICICLLMLGGMLWYDYRIILMVVILCLPVFALYYLFQKKVLSKIGASFRKLTPIGSIVLTQSIDSFAETKIYKKQNFFIHQITEIRKTTARHLSNLTTVTNVPARFFEVVSVLSFTAIISYAKIFETNQNLVVLLGLLSIALYKIIPSVNRILICLSNIDVYAYSITELRKSFSETFAEQCIEKEEVMFMKSIRFSGVSYQYTKGSDHFQLQDVSIAINKGDFIVLAGASGTGKTTFIHLLASLIKDYEGTILMDDTNLQSVLRGWQNKIGFAPQAAVVLQTTLLHNIAFGENEREIDTARVHDVLAMVELSDWVNQLPLQLKTQVSENGLTLSGGQRQRLILARALYRNPEVLLLDEVTNQLDQENKIKILIMLKKLSKSGKTIVLASHDPIVRKYANRILVFENKKIREVDLHQTVF